MDRRRLLIGALSAGWFGSSRTYAANPRGRKHLAVLLLGSAENWDFLPPELRAELGALGWVEGTNLSIEWRYVGEDAVLVRSHAEQLVATAPDAILTRGTPATRALQEATRTIPILTGLGDPVGSGFAKSFARPGGNVTGISYAVVETAAKHVELLRALVPRLALLNVVFPDRGSLSAEVPRPILKIASAVGLEARMHVVTNVAEVRLAIRSNRAPGEVAAVISGMGNIVEPAVLARDALEQKMPTMFDVRPYVDAGGLASYRLNWANQTQRTAAQIDKVLRGETPGQIPFELPTVTEFVLNRRTARLLGIALPQSLLLRANSIVD